MSRTAIRIFSGPTRDVAVGRDDPAIACVLRARACRLSGDIDNAELWLNEAAATYRALGVPNTSRSYRIESRSTLYARLNEIEGPEEEE